MSEIIVLDSISKFNAMSGTPTLHPLVSVVDMANVGVFYESPKLRYELYAILLKEGQCNEVKYGRNRYDYQDGTLVFFAPGQIAELLDSELPYTPNGKALVFHPDLLLGTSLGKAIGSYSFFGYENAEALHLSEAERQFTLTCLANIQTELQLNLDKHSRYLIVSNIELFLNYCKRFYDRQFITREHINHGILERFEQLLDDYFSSGKTSSEGIPSVAYCAENLHLSANYFGDLIKKETGKSAQEYIQYKVIEQAKKLLFNNKDISEIAYELGFAYPQNFTRLFKKIVGKSPNEFRKAV